MFSTVYLASGLNVCFWPKAVITLLFNIAFRSELETDAVLAQLLAIPLRDGCDLLDIIGQRLCAGVAGAEAAPLPTAI
ncbi:hypothetical protein [Pseudomonas sp. CBZ-4]|uniref:hypothetical protein n=1 Tax=Pseudomonas sp. CBZ-4 TaxID=1163065 RepID=UPI0035256494